MLSPYFRPEAQPILITFKRQEEHLTLTSVASLDVTRFPSTSDSVFIVFSDSFDDVRLSGFGLLLSIVSSFLSFTILGWNRTP